MVAAELVLSVAAASELTRAAERVGATHVVAGAEVLAAKVVLAAAEETWRG